MQSYEEYFVGAQATTDTENLDSDIAKIEDKYGDIQERLDTLAEKIDTLNIPPAGWVLYQASAQAHEAFVKGAVEHERVFGKDLGVVIFYDSGHKISLSSIRKSNPYLHVP